MVFFLIAVVLMLVGRKVGWALSRRALYPAPAGVAAPFCVLWGYIVALGMRSLIDYQHPGLILRWIMGYALAAYVAIPNYGLFDEATIPDHAARRHMLVSNLPLSVYIAASIALAFAGEATVAASMGLSLAALAGAALFALGKWASRRPPVVANVAAFALAAGASLSAGLALDLWVQAWAGRIPPGNLISPTFFWLYLAAAGLAASSTAMQLPSMVSAPFLLNGLVAVVGLVVDIRYLLVAGPLFLVGVGAHMFLRHRSKRSKVAA